MKPMGDFGLGVVVGTVLGTGLAILLALVPAPTSRYLLLPPDLAAQHQAEGSPPAAPLVASRVPAIPPARRTTQHATARDTVLAAAKRA